MVSFANRFDGKHCANCGGQGWVIFLRSENKPVSVGYIGSVKNFEVFALPKIDDMLETEIVIENQVFNVTMISGKIRCNDILIAQCEMKIFITK